VRADVQRGRLLFLSKEAHKRLLPGEAPEKLGKRMWLVVQGDKANESSPYTIVVSVSTAPRDKTKSDGTDVILPVSPGLAHLRSVADCAAIHCIHEQDINTAKGGVLSGNYYNVDGVMGEVDDALRLAMDLDPDKILAAR
jgi:mRNA-degrading endonuclease toxin of MazEF toxin-antitoxin module